MRIQNQVDLRSFNTFGISAIAEKFIEFNSEEDLLYVADYIDRPPLVLGGGSNILIEKESIPLVLKNNILGIKTLKDSDEYVLIEVGAGVNWHELVLWTVDHNYGGIENLSLIPGNTGAAPIQNIGAYGVELKDVFHSLWFFDFKQKLIKSFQKNECDFGYRSSIFKKELKNKGVITKVILKLSKSGHHVINQSYGAIGARLLSKNISEPNIKDISNAVIEIRESKLPDPSQIGNAGSFFKNPIVSGEVFKQLEMDFPNVAAYPLDDGTVKLAAGWLIDQCGWKGKREGDVGTYKNQALVIVNHGNATGKEIIALSKNIQRSVLHKFGVSLEAEVNIISN